MRYRVVTFYEKIRHGGKAVAAVYEIEGEENDHLKILIATAGTREYGPWIEHADLNPFIATWLDRRKNPCPSCHGRGWVRDKPWKGPHRWWMNCYDCNNTLNLPEPDHAPAREEAEAVD